MRLTVTVSRLDVVTVMICDGRALGRTCADTIPTKRTCKIVSFTWKWRVTLLPPSCSGKEARFLWKFSGAATDSSIGI
jgi:hypothetical protein